MVIEVKKDGRYEDGTGRSREFKAGKVELSDALAARFVEANPGVITIAGSSAPKQDVDENVFN